MALQAVLERFFYMHKVKWIRGFRFDHDIDVTLFPGFIPGNGPEYAKAPDPILRCGLFFEFRYDLEYFRTCQHRLSWKE